MVQLFFILSMVLVNIFTYSSLPAQIPTHWGLNGQIDSYSAKEYGIWIMPIMSLLIFGLFKFVAQLDPKNKNYKLFAHEWNIMQTTLVGFLTYIHFLMLYFTFNPSTNFLQVFFIGFGVFFALFGNYMSKIRQNYFIGMRTPWALDNVDNWNKTQRCASWCFVITGIVIIIEAFVLWIPAVVIFGSIILSVIVPTIYSYLLYRNNNTH